jgi:hypothetical protein
MCSFSSDSPITPVIPDGEVTARGDEQQGAGCSKSTLETYTEVERSTGEGRASDGSEVTATFWTDHISDAFPEDRRVSDHL